MSENERKKRGPPISVRYNPDELEILAENVRRFGRSRSAFIKYRTVGTPPPPQSRRPSVEERLLGRVLAELTLVREELHEANVAGRCATSLYEESVALQADILDAVLERGKR